MKYFGTGSGCSFTWVKHYDSRFKTGWLGVSMVYTYKTVDIFKAVLFIHDIFETKVNIKLLNWSYLASFLSLHLISSQANLDSAWPPNR